MLRRFAAFFLALAVLFATEPTAAQNAPAAPAQPKPQIALDAVALTILIKSTIIALQQANVTGNYSVLRDLGTPVFRERFNQTHLAEVFANLRNRGINLNPAIVLSPTLAKQPQVTEQGVLQVEGAFATQPLQIQFNISFQLIDGAWRIQGLAVDAAPPPGVANAEPAKGTSASSGQNPPGKPAAKTAAKPAKADKKTAN